MDYITPDVDQHIRRVIRSCGREATLLAAKDFQVVEKGPQDYVTSIDRTLDYLLTNAFTSAFPRDGIITEENVASRQVYYQGYQRLWFIDPIDGTSDLIHQRPNYSVMVGLLDNYAPTAGWVHAPARDQLYSGSEGQGVFCSDGDAQPVLMQQSAPPAPNAEGYPIMLGARDQKVFGAAIAKQIPNVQFRSIGSFGLKVIEVITGRVGLYVYLNKRVKLWDTTAPLALARAAGLACCDLDGKPIRFTPDAIHPESLAHLQPIIIGWPEHVETLRPKIQQAVQQIVS